MRKNNLFRIIIAIGLLLWAVYSLFPSYSLIQQREVADSYYAELTAYTGFTRDDINEALNAGDLNLRVQELSLKGDSLQHAQDVATKLTGMHPDIVQNEDKSIKLGLDLLGGTYLVYEVDLPKLVEINAKLRDAKLDSLIAEARSQNLQTGEDFFNLFSALFAKENIRLYRYFGKRSQSNDEIIAELNTLATDAIDRTLEVIRNRVDRFGVAEPSITKQGNRRLVIELAGVTDVERAKKIIGDTALLEFKLVKDNDAARTILQDIDNIWKKHIQGDAANGLQDSTTANDSTLASNEQSSDVDELLGTSILPTESDSADGSDTDLLINPTYGQKYPFFALLDQTYADIPAQNLLAVKRIINHPKIQRVIPNDVEIRFYSKPDIRQEEEYYRFEVLKKEPEITGRYLEKADVTISSGTQSLTQGQPEVSLKFDREGARIFSRVTGANVGKRLAIILDGNVASAPNIDERIPRGEAVIRGSFTMQEANDLSVILRAGALPAPVIPIEERTVGPSLGKDSVRQGQISIMAGIVLVVLFMVFYYRMSGLVANVALIFNLIIILAFLAARGATLTLPGVAGIILTIGMAVDANVLIFERIREELRTGKTVRAAIDAGYSRAFWTIVDANVTTFLTGLVLYQFGTGPIKGFALTLMIGIMASLFTAIVVTRIIFDYFTQKRNVAKLSI
ncbi:MAG: protein translocase subunit SecD [bacterium]